jgi:protein dithiol:quinone oxidoreductase
MQRSSSSAGPYLACAALSLAAVGAALFTQYQWSMQPCPWCVLQRLLYLLIAAVALLAAAAQSLRFHGLAQVGAGLMLLLATSGVAAAVWQHFVAAAKDSCKRTLAEQIVQGLGLDERWPEVFVAFASCADAAVKVLGLPYEFYSLGLFVGLAGAATWLLLRQR